MNPPAQNKLISNQKYLPHLKKADNYGNISAMTNIGSLYFYGLGVAQDYTKAMKWYRKAANEGNLTATRNITLMYHKGQGVNQDYTKMFNWLKKTAELGDADAM